MIMKGWRGIYRKARAGTDPVIDILFRRFELSTSMNCAFGLALYRTDRKALGEFATNEMI